MKKKGRKICKSNWQKSNKDMSGMFALLILSLILLSGCTSNNGKPLTPEIRYIDKIVEIERPDPLPYKPCELRRPQLTDNQSFSVELSMATAAVAKCNEENGNASDYNMRLIKKRD